MDVYPPKMKVYFESLQHEIDVAYELARKARAQGKDPIMEVEVPQATDMAGRVESLVGPKGVAGRIRELVKEHGKELAALKVVDEIIDGRFGDLGSKENVAEQAVRTALAILTEGIVSAPLEGIAEVKIKRNRWADNTEYLALYYAGPIRSSGGTAQALSVLVGDYVRKRLGLDRFKPSEEHVERMVEEVDLYHRVVTRLQYHPEADEIRLAVRNIPIEITGEETDKVEVSHRDVPGIETNHLRGGGILVLAEGVLQKAKKLVKYIDKMSIEGWDWIKEFVRAKERGDTEKADESYGQRDEGNGSEDIGKGFYYKLYERFKARIAPNVKYTKEIIGGRPLFAEPSRNGGFRLRYGRSRVSGFATWSVNPSTMVILDEFIAIGTQMKTERPGKGCIVTPTTTVEGPIVKLRNGDVIRVDDYDTALRVRDEVREVLYVGDALINFGDFVENNHTLIPANYAEEWWIQEIVRAIGELYEVELEPFSDNAREAVEEAAEYLEVDADFLHALLRDPLSVKPSVEQAIHLSKVLDVPFHPYYTLYWNTLKPEEAEELQKALLNAKIEWKESRKNKFAVRIVMEREPTIKRYLELIGLPHRLERTDGGRKVIVVEYPWSAALLTPLGNFEWEFRAKPFHTVIDIINENNRVKLRDRGISWIGARMGRPEKAKERRMKPPVQVLFPIGLAGGSSRDIKKASENARKTRVEIAWFRCPKCGHTGPEHVCPTCGVRKALLWHCPACDSDYEQDEAESFDFRCPRCDVELRPYTQREVDPQELLREAMERVGVYSVDRLKGVKGMTSGYKMAEPLEKGLLRAKNGVYVFKDGTIRFDSTDAPLTHFRPREIGVPVDRLKALGYTHDFEGKPLERDDQIVELKVQDVILPREAGEYLLKVARFVDDLLEKFYDLPRFYKAEKVDDLIGHLVVGLAPHTSAGVVGRIIGFSDVLVGYAHPYYHAAKRRNCDGDEDSVMLLMDALLNFSRYYLPEKRGGKMDAPLVVTTRLDPREVDSEVHNMDVAGYYPLEFYSATYEFKSPKEVRSIERVEDRLGRPEMYTGIKFTHDTDGIAVGPKMSRYKQLGDMAEKVQRQLALAERIRAVDENHVAETILNSHIIPDLRGNLRSFTRQEFRCVKCNAKYRRPPLTGKCPKCGGKIVLTVSKGAVEKYLSTAKMLVTRYAVKYYTKQRICLTEKDIKTLFETVLPERQKTLVGFSADVCERMIRERTGSVRKRRGILETVKGGENGKKVGDVKRVRPLSLQRDERKETPKNGKKPRNGGMSLDNFLG